MPRWDDVDDEDWDDDDDGPYDDEIPLVPCPFCREEILEEAERCPECGAYLSREDAPAARKPWWLIVGAIAGLIAACRCAGLFRWF